MVAKNRKIMIILVIYLEALILESKKSNTALYSKSFELLLFFYYKIMQQLIIRILGFRFNFGSIVVYCKKSNLRLFLNPKTL